VALGGILTMSIVGDFAMKDTYTAVVKKSGAWWIGWVEEVPGVNCQEASKKELMESLQVTLREALELNRRDAIEAAGEGFNEEPIVV
jgi:predicted RNase H-like HicB family nuclease